MFFSQQPEEQAGNNKGFFLKQKNKIFPGNIFDRSIKTELFFKSFFL